MTCPLHRAENAPLHPCGADLAVLIPSQRRIVGQLRGVVADIQRRAGRHGARWSPSARGPHVRPAAMCQLPGRGIRWQSGRAPAGYGTADRRSALLRLNSATNSGSLPGAAPSVHVSTWLACGRPDDAPAAVPKHKSDAGSCGSCRTPSCSSNNFKRLPNRAAFGCKLLQRLPYQSSIATLMAVTYSAAILRADFCHHQPSFLLTQAADDICSSAEPASLLIRPSPQGLRDSIQTWRSFRAWVSCTGCLARISHSAELNEGWLVSARMRLGCARQGDVAGAIVASSGIAASWAALLWGMLAVRCLVRVRRRPCRAGDGRARTRPATGRRTPSRP